MLASERWLFNFCGFTQQTRLRELTRSGKLGERLAVGN